MLAIAAAYHLGQVYHRDLSLGNVMMTENQGDSDGPWGILNDWDHARKINAEPTDRVVRSSMIFLTCLIISVFRELGSLSRLGC